MSAVDPRGQRLTVLTGAVEALGVRVRVNRNRRVLLSLRQQRSGSAVLSLHGGLLDHPQALDAIPAWVRTRGRRPDPAIREALSQVWRQLHQRSSPSPVPECPALGGPVDLQAFLDQVHAAWFDHLPRPAIRWARSGPRRRLRHIRFGCYRKGPPAEILINPRLQLPWVARIFLEHVLHHELCHHAQVCMPVRGETAHSRRFRMLEQGYPHHAQALAWERANLHRLLGDDAQG